MCSASSSASFSELRLLLWKNYLLKKRRFVSCLFEIVVPILAILILILIRSLVHIESVDEHIYTTQYDILPAEPFLAYSLACGDFIASNPSLSKTRYPYEQIAIYINPNQKKFREKLVQTIQMQLSFIYQNNSVIAPISPLQKCVNYDVSLGGLTGLGDSVDLNQFIWNNTYIHGVHFPMIKLYDSVEELESYYLDNGDYGMDVNVQTLAFSVLFDDESLFGNSQGKRQYSYTIRANSSDLPYTGTITDPLQVGFDNDTWTIYYKNSIVTLQTIIDRYIVHYSSVQDIDEAPLPVGLYDVSFIPFPVPSYSQDNFKDYIGSIFALFLVLSFMWPFSRLVRNIVEEKEKKIKEGMKMMGLTNWTFWASWALTYILLFTILCVVMILVSKKSIFPYSDGALIFFFFFSFSLSLISLAALLTTFFDRAKSAGTISPFMLLLLWLPYFAVSDPTKDTNSKNFASLLAPIAFSLGADNLLSFEAAFIGVQNSNISQVVDNYTFGSSIAFLLFDFLLYALLAWYIDAIYPSQWGSHKPFYFLCTPSYWKETFSSCTKRAKKSNLNASIHLAPVNEGETLQSPLLDSSMLNSSDNFDFGTDYEPVPAEFSTRLAVTIRSLKKQFGSSRKPVVAVKDLDLNLYSGQIFVLLGHNGAGKTTTINMLTGMLPLTSGDANIYGYSVKDNIDDIRKFLGICPQHDVLFDDLTVEEHLLFFAQLKRVAKDSLSSLVQRAIEEVKLSSKAHAKASELSGGQRRRLSLAIALIGDSKVVFLDEPTSGVDPFSRRAIWDLLTLKKPGRVIILTTHFMDEADQLGDRIGIMHQGSMRVCGTSLFLKKMFGVGYTLTFTKLNKSSNAKLKQLIAMKIPESSIVTDVGTELNYKLPLTASSVFPEIFSEIDDHRQEFNVSNYGLSVTTLEEVFVRVAAEADELSSPTSATPQHDSIEKKSATATDSSVSTEALSSNPQHSYFTRHFFALLKKRWNITKRDKKAALCQLVIPIILLSLGLGLLRIPPNFDFPNLQLSIDGYNQPLSVPINTPLKPLFTHFNSQDAYIQVFNESEKSSYAAALLNSRESTEQGTSRYGAYYFESFDMSSYGLNASLSSPLLRYSIFTNISAPHAMPTFLNLGNNLILQNITEDLTATIATTIHPFSFTKNQRSAIENINGIFASIVISFGFSFIPASFAVFVVSEREFKSKHLQSISGVSMVAYWAANYLWDFLSFLLPAIISSIIILAYANPVFTGANFGPVALSFLLYGLSVIPFTYCLSFLFTSHSTAQNVMILVYIVGGIVLTMVGFALYQIDSTREANDRYIRHLFRLVPNYCLGDSIFYLSVRGFVQRGAWDMKITGFDLVFMTFESIAYFLLTLLLEYAANNPAFLALFKSKPKAVEKPSESMDDDVAAEKERLLAGGDSSHDLIRVCALRKVYPNKIAVNDLSFGVSAGTCFGFLGVNGAGNA
jgi:ATP-binding cassette subfamily A (ABC1) protein 3